MRPPPSLRGWLKPTEFAAWIRAAPDVETHQRRLAIALVAQERLHVPTVARMLFVSPRSVVRWLAQYNAGGPVALTPQPRGGRREAHLSIEAEAAVLAPFHDAALRGEIRTASMIRDAVEQAVGRPVSTKYLRDLLVRHDWRKVTPRPQHPKADPIRQARYKKFLPPHPGCGESPPTRSTAPATLRG